MNRTRWPTLKLKYCVQLCKNRADEVPQGLDFIGLENIESWTGRRLGKDQLGNSEEGGGTSTVNLFTAGDVIFGKLRPYLAKAWLADFDGACSTEGLVLRPLESVSGRFFQQCLLTRSFIDAVDETTFGSKMPRADWDSIGAIQIPLPPLSTQQAIAGHLDRQTKRLDELVRAKEGLRELVAEKRRALVTRAVTRGISPQFRVRDSGIPWLGPIPEHWEQRRLAYLFHERDERGEPELPLLEVSIDRGVALREFSNDKIEGTAADLGTMKVARKGDVVFNKMRMWQGAVGVAPCDGLTSPDYVVAIPVGHDLHTDYARELFRTAMFSAECARHSHGIVWDRLRLYWEGFRDISIPVPPLAEQRAIAAYIVIETAKLDALHASAERTIRLLRERRSALISAAVTGQIPVS